MKAPGPDFVFRRYRSRASENRVNLDLPSGAGSGSVPGPWSIRHGRVVSILSPFSPHHRVTTVTISTTTSTTIIIIISSLFVPLCHLFARPFYTYTGMVHYGCWVRTRLRHPLQRTVKTESSRQTHHRKEWTLIFRIHRKGLVVFFLPDVVVVDSLYGLDEDDLPAVDRGEGEGCGRKTYHATCLRIIRILDMRLTD